MDEFKDLEEEISKLEEGLTGDDFIGRLRSPAPGDYWKKRLEDEKELWNKTVEAKEQENRRLEKKLSNTEEELKAIQRKLSEIELGMQKDSREWEERMRNKDMETALDKERAAWSGKVKEFERENETLKTRVDELKLLAQEAAKNAELRLGESESTHKNEMETLLHEQEGIVSSLEEMDSQAAKLREESAGKEKEIALLNQKIAELTAQKNRLDAIIKTKEGQFARALARQQKQVIHLAEHTAGAVRKFAGMLLGIIDFCEKRLERSFFFGSTTIKRQLLVAGTMISEMMEAINSIKTMISGVNTEAAPAGAARFVLRLDEDADVSKIPQSAEILLASGLSAAIKRMKGGIRKASAVYSDSPTGGELEVRISVDKGSAPSGSELPAVEFYAIASNADFELRDSDTVTELVLKFQCQKYS